MEDKSQQDRRSTDNKHWHLEKTVSVGHIITTLTVAGSMLIWAMTINTRVTVLEAESIHAQQTDARLELSIKDSVARIESALIRIEDNIRNKADRRQ